MQQERTTDLKILMGLGIFAIAAMIILPFIAIGFIFQRGDELKKCMNGELTGEICEKSELWSFLEEMPDFKDEVMGPAVPEPSPKGGGLGSEGSVCGGADRLPCTPGLVCATSQGETMGICVKDEAVTNGQ
ncbi:MAG: hypothetical protein WC787_01405 [Patescibacteria group bacterium]|jgi:hypothetical protein